jgi:hypothetical protein
MNFIRLSETTERIECMTISPNKRFVAVCERQTLNSGGYDPERNGSVKRIPVVRVYNTRSHSGNTGKNQSGLGLSAMSSANDPKTFTYADTVAESFCCMRFSDDSRFLVLVTAAPEYKLVFIDILQRIKDIP